MQMMIQVFRGRNTPAVSFPVATKLIFGGIYLMLTSFASHAGAIATSDVAVDSVITSESSDAQVVTLTATVTTPGGGTPIETGEVSFQVKDSGGGNIGTAEVDTSLSAGGVAEVSYTLPADILGSFTIFASYTDPFMTFGPGSGSNTLNVVPVRVFVDAAGDFTVTTDVAPLGGNPTTGDTVTWTSTNLGTETGATFGVNAFDSIQDAVNGVNDGGLVFIADGTYTEGSEIGINKNVRIFGDDGATTILDGGGTHRVISIGSGSFVVQLGDVTIQNGNADGMAVGGGGIFTASTANLSISSSILSNNSADSGGGNNSGGGAIFNSGT
ncbi:MAG: hypothetical protein ACI9R3_006279, partial [Verrucomicrobiales bacterium]